MELFDTAIDLLNQITTTIENFLSPITDLVERWNNLGGGESGSEQ